MHHPAGSPGSLRLILGLLASCAVVSWITGAWIQWLAVALAILVSLWVAAALNK